jgi:hypothetical protein
MVRPKASPTAINSKFCRGIPASSGSSQVSHRNHPAIAIWNRHQAIHRMGVILSNS